jgi:hypothetical protein
MITYRTLADFITNKTKVSAHCRKAPLCWHHSHLDLEALARRYGADMDFYEVDLRPRMRCTACGAKGAGFIVSPHIKTALELDAEEKARKAGS